MFIAIRVIVHAAVTAPPGRKILPPAIRQFDVSAHLTTIRFPVWQYPMLATFPEAFHVQDSS
ncbi:hypothetical protein, partial [Klebsiella pneumoniae]|uniref:hypothetical protein n=1 Tax=Klebsiella pneumoniae TaxID=573 RepID=UPI0030ECC367